MDPMSPFVAILIAWVVFLALWIGLVATGALDKPEDREPDIRGPGLD